MHDIFLSYASEDRDRARQLAAVLEQLGWKVWWDRTILPGRTFDKVIEGALNEAPCVVVLWSKASVDSPWVRAEAGEALNRGHLIPALLEEVDIPLVFRQIQAAPLADWKGESDHPGLIRLARAITTFVAPSAASAETPGESGTATEPAAPEPMTPDPAPASQEKPVPPAKQAPDTARAARTSHLWPAIAVIALLVAAGSFWVHRPPPGEPQPEHAGIPGTTVIQATRDEPRDETLASAPPSSPPAPKTARPATRAKEAARPVTPPPVTAPSPKKPSTRPETAIAKPAPVAATPPAPRAVPATPPPKPVSSHRAPPASSSSRSAPASGPEPATPPAPVTKQMPGPPPLKILVVVWGTPKDDGLSSPASTRKYSRNLSAMMTGILKTAVRQPATFEYRFIKDREHHRLMRDRPDYEESATLCKDANARLLVMGFVEGSEFDETIGFVPSRKPFFSAYDCRTGKGAAKRFTVGGARDDQYAYEKSLDRAFRSFARNELVSVQQTLE